MERMLWRPKVCKDEGPKTGQNHKRLDELGDSQAGSHTSEASGLTLDVVGPLTTIIDQGETGYSHSGGEAVS